MYPVTSNKKNAGSKSLVLQQVNQMCGLQTQNNKRAWMTLEWQKHCRPPLSLSDFSLGFVSLLERICLVRLNCESYGYWSLIVDS